MRSIMMSLEETFLLSQGLSLIVSYLLFISLLSNSDSSGKTAPSNLFVHLSLDKRTQHSLVIC